MNNLRCEYSWWVWRAPSLQFSFQDRMQWFLCPHSEKFAKMVRTCENDAKIWWNGEIGNWWNPLAFVRPACLQVASARPTVKQTGKNTSEPRETRGITLHETFKGPAVGHGQIIEFLFGQAMRDRRIWCAAPRMHDVETKPLNIFQESNPVPSHLVPEFQHKRWILRKG